MITMRSRIAVLASTLAVGAATSIITPMAAQAETVYSFADVQGHGTRADCWSIVNGGVYNLTNFIGRHEGGPAPIIAMCGIDGTVSYNTRHPSRAGENEPAAVLRQYRIGVLDPKSVPSASAATYTPVQVAAHGTAANCWSIVGGKVYNLTGWVTKHPGGPALITSMCGIDGTTLYSSKHAGSATAGAVLAQYVIGTASASSGSTGTSASAHYTLAQVAKHGTTADCWSAVSGGVYNLTTWIPKHPGGPALITSMCGIDGTTLYSSKHAGSASAGAVLAQFKVGILGTAGTTTAKRTYTMKQVRRHNTAANCWSVVNKNVYNLTAWFSSHPGGRPTSAAVCGRNGTAAFNAKYSGSANATTSLKPYKIGRLA